MSAVNYDDFVERLQVHLKRLDHCEANYRHDPALAPSGAAR